MIIKFLIWLFIPKKSCEHDYEHEYTYRRHPYDSSSMYAKKIFLCKHCLKIKEINYNNQ